MDYTDSPEGQAELERMDRDNEHVGRKRRDLIADKENLRDQIRHKNAQIRRLLKAAKECVESLDYINIDRDEEATRQQIERAGRALGALRLEIEEQSGD